MYEARLIIYYFAIIGKYHKVGIDNDHFVNLMNNQMEKIQPNNVKPSYVLHYKLICINNIDS